MIGPDIDPSENIRVVYDDKSPPEKTSLKSTWPLVLVGVAAIGFIMGYVFIRK